MLRLITHCRWNLEWFKYEVLLLQPLKGNVAKGQSVKMEVGPVSGPAQYPIIVDRYRDWLVLCLTKRSRSDLGTYLHLALKIVGSNWQNQQASASQMRHHARASGNNSTGRTTRVEAGVFHFLFNHRRTGKGQGSSYDLPSPTEQGKKENLNARTSISKENA